MDLLTTILQFWDTLVGRVIGSLILAGLTYLVLKLAVPFFTRRTKYEIDDVIVGTLRLPLPLIILFWGLVSALPLTGLPEDLVSIGSRVGIVLLILLSAYLMLKLLSDVVARYAEEHSKETESNLDDVLVPLLTQRVVPLVILVAAIITVLAGIGVDLGALFTGLGALSFLLIFLFQEPISNLFSGVYLVLDVPFKYGDLIILEDEKTYRVEEIGARVTKLYNTDDHTLAFVPNNKLAGQRLINVTRPTVELRMKIPIGVAYGTKDLARVQEILVGAANAHPHILGSLTEKLEAMEQKLPSITDENDRIRFAMETERLRVEDAIRIVSENLIRRLQFLQQFVYRLEAGGLDPREDERIHGIMDSIWPMVHEMRRRLTIWLHLVGRLDANYKWSEPVVPLTAAEIDRRLPSADQLEEWRESKTEADQIKRQLLGKDCLAVLGTFIHVDEEFYLAGSVPWLEFSKEVDLQGPQASILKSLETWKSEQPTWDTFKDYYILYQSWHKPVWDLLRRLEACSQPERLRGEEEFSLDDRLGKVVELLDTRFLLPTPGWKYPSADFVGFGASSIDFRLEFFVDDLVRRHFELMGDVISEVGLDIMQRFNAEGIEIPFPQTDVWFRDAWLKETLGKLEKGTHSK